MGVSLGSGLKRAIAVVLFLGFVCGVRAVKAQVEPPSRKYILEEDAKKAKQRLLDQESQTLKAPGQAGEDLNINAPQVEFLKESKEVKASGGALVDSGGTQLRSRTVLYNTESKDAKLSDDVAVSLPGALISGKSGSFNLDSETGVFEQSDLRIDQQGYQGWADRIEKLSEFDYRLTNAGVSTCGCSDGTRPWEIHGNDSTVTQEGYAWVHGATLRMWGAPILYSPIMGFPVKTGRASGLLAPDFGYSSRDGIKLRVPIFGVIDESSDITFAPFTETKTRTGFEFDLRKIFSTQNDFEGGIIYSNESARDGSFRGVDYSDVYDPHIDTNRFGGYLRHNWRNDPESEWQVGLNSDIRYTSDPIFLREINNANIGDERDRFLTSSILFNSNAGEYGSFELYNEYNEAIASDNPDLVFQRLPEATLAFSKSYRPFGYNPFGFKIVPKITLNAADFVRSEGYDGWRGNIAPAVAIPFRYQNYFSSQFTAVYNATSYNLRDQAVPDMSQQLVPPDAQELNSSENRSIYALNYAISTGVERVYDLDKGNWLSTLAGLGAKNQNSELVRLKHTVVPNITYNFTPDVDQEDLPTFDSFDRLRHKSVVGLGLRTSLFGRFMPKLGKSDEITELTPEINDIPYIGGESGLPDFGFDSEDLGGAPAVRKGEVRELARLDIKRSYDFVATDVDPSRHSWSDIGTNLGLYPSRYLGLLFGSTYNTYDSDFTSWSLGSSLRDDRGDVLRARYNFVQESVSQIEANVEVVIKDRLKAGYYTRYDNQRSEFIDNMALVRYSGSCGCWHVDLGLRDQVNPDKKSLTLNFTFVGLGDVRQNIGLPGSSS